MLPRSLLQRLTTTGPIDPARTAVVGELRHTSPLLGGRFDPSGRFFFAGSQDNSVQRWDLATGVRTAFTGHRSWIRALAFRGDRLFSADYNGKILVWQAAAASPTPDREIDAHRGWIRALAVSRDGRLVASCGNDHLVRLWNAETLEPVRAFEGHEHHVYNIAFHPREPQLVSGDLQGTLRQWNLTDGRQTRTMDCSVLYRYDPTFRAGHGGIRSMTFNAEGTLLACAGITNVTNAFAGVGNPAVVLFDWASGNRVRVHRPRAAFQGTGWGVCFHPSGFILGAGGGSGGKLFFWRGTEEQAVSEVAFPVNARDLDLHPNQHTVAVPLADGGVRLFDLA